MKYAPMSFVWTIENWNNLHKMILVIGHDQSHRLTWRVAPLLAIQLIVDVDIATVPYKQ